jgi:hypothetical protein
MRRFSWFVVLLLVLSAQQALAQCVPSEFYNLSASNGTWAFETNCADLEVWVAGQVQVDWSIEADATYVAPLVSPSGRFVGYTRLTHSTEAADELYLYDVETDSSRVLLTGFWSGWSWTVDGNIILALKNEEGHFDIAHLNLETGLVQIIYVGNFSQPILSPRGVVVAYQNYDEQTQLADLVIFSAEGEMQTLLVQVEVYEGGPGWNADFTKFSVSSTTRYQQSTFVFQLSELGRPVAEPYGEVVWHPTDPNLFAASANGHVFVSDGHSLTFTPMDEDVQSYVWADQESLLLSTWNYFRPKPSEHGLWISDENVFSRFFRVA